MQRFVLLRVLGPLFIFLSGSASPLFSYQMADGAPPVKAPAEKYIFYWGSLQCDLTETNGYKGAISLPPAAFRRMLLQPPRLWDGKMLLKSFQFDLEGKRIDTENYLPQLGDLDVAFGQKVVPGQVLRLGGLRLDTRIEARIDFQIIAPEQKDEKSARTNWSPFPSNYVNTRLVSRVVWGREDAYDVSNRDFFTVAEFWQTVRLMPVVEWQPYSTPQGVTASIRFPDLATSSFSLTARLDEEDYRRLLGNLDNYKHLAHPGATVDLALFAAESYTELFQKTMTLVTDNDPRLALRRNRDQHMLVLQMGKWQEKIQDLYLFYARDAQGQLIPVDQPISRRSGYSTVDPKALFSGPFEVWIDGSPVPGASCRLTVSGDTFRLQTGETLPDTLVQTISRLAQKDAKILLDSFSVPGYDLPAIDITLSYYNPFDRLPVRNQFDSLYAASSTVLVKIKPPTYSQNHYYFDFELPVAAPARFSIFEPGGWNVFVSEDQFSTGLQTMRVPRSAFRNPGKHYCFLNTPLGVAKMEFEVE